MEGERKFTELLPPVPRSDERTILPLGTRIYRRVLTSLSVQIYSQLCIPRIVERRELTVFDERTLFLS